MDVFLSWSGSTSRQVAEVLSEWLPTVVQRVKPWISSRDIASGQRWFDQVSNTATSYSYGLFCLTPENINSRWMHYEAGALSSFGEDAHIVGLLLQGLSPAQIGGPLGQYQHIVLNKSGMEKLLTDMNELAGDDRLSQDVLARTFERAWPEFEDQYNTITAMASMANPVPERSLRDMQEELLELVRSMHWATRKMPKHVERTLAYVEAQYRQLGKDMKKRGEGLPPVLKRPPIHGEAITVYPDGKIEREEVVPENHKNDIFD